MYIGNWMERASQYWPERLAVVDIARGSHGRFTYRQLNERANRLAGWLRAHGVVHGDRVGLLAHNGVEYLDLFFACGKLGAIFVPYNWRLHARELVEVVEQTRPKVLAFSDDFRPLAMAVQDDPRTTISGWLHLDGDGIRGSLAYEPTLQASIEQAVDEPTVQEEDIICLLFTGGTTGLPKGAQISYRMVAWNTLNTVVHELNRDDVTVIHTPMFHTGGLLVYTLPLLTLGGTLILMRRWDPEEMLELIGRERVTMFFCVPTQYQQMMQCAKFAGTDFSSVRFMTSGGAPLPVSLIHDWRRVHDVAFKQGFGMTEFGPGIFSMGPEFAELKAGSVGRPNYFVEARLVDDENRAVAVGEVGELVLRGPSCFSGYFDNPKATAEAMDEQGWFHTGDMARTDAEGFFYIVDRKKEMFISGGENVYPAEIERALYEHPAIHMCAVVGMADPKWGEVGRAVVVLKQGTSATSEELIEFMRTRLARFKVPRSVYFWESLPISAAGKILRREIKASFDHPA